MQARSMSGRDLASWPDPPRYHRWLFGCPLKARHLSFFLFHQKAVKLGTVQLAILTVIGLVLPKVFKVSLIAHFSSLTIQWRIAGYRNYFFQLEISVNLK